MDIFVYGKSSFRLDYLSEMKKTDFEKQFGGVLDVKDCWSKIQKELKVKGYKKNKEKKQR